MRIILQARSRIKALASDARQRIFFALLIALTALIAFGLGRLSVIYGEGSAIQISYPAASAEGR